MSFETPSFDQLNHGLTIEITKTDEGYEAHSPNHPQLAPAAAEDRTEAIQAYQRRVRAYLASGFDVKKANEVDVSAKSRDPLVCG